MVEEDTTGRWFAGTGTSTGSFQIGAGSGGKWSFFTENNVNRFNGTTSIQKSTWYHVAVSRSGSTIKLFVNGSEEASATDSVNYSATSLGIGGYSSTNASCYGYISNFRIVVGTALYTSAFTPSTTPLTAITNTKLLTCQSNRFVDNSSDGNSISIQTGTPKVTPFSPFKDDNARDITTDGGSGYFSGSDYLIKTSGVPTIGTSDFTVECWFYSNDASAGFRCLYDGREIAPDGVGIFQNGGDIEVWTSSKLIEQTVIRPNEWMHLALVRNSGSMQLYINGSASGSAVSFTTNCTSDERIIGENTANSGYYFKGYISDLRETHSAVYTSAFTPPTAPLTAITNTELLLNFHDAGIYDRSGINNLDTVGNAQIDTAVKKYGTGSLEFDGSGDWLDVTGDSASFEFGTGDFTIEMWANWANGSSLQFLYDSRPTSTNGVYPALYLNSNTLVWYISSGARITSSTLSNNTWYHIAICRSSGSTKLFVNGVQEGSTYTDANNYLNPDSRPTIGREGFGTSWNFNGYIDDLRVTKGVARYTADFTPPDAALPKF